jgi:DNA-directed RNA polymerase sigma subunit (sigma70/sigma32)
MSSTNGAPIGAPDPTAQRDRNRELYDQRVAAEAKLAEAEASGNRIAARAARAASEAALAALHSENQRLVARVCRPFRSDDDRQAYRDYLDAGSLALLEAIYSWDPDKGQLGYWSTKHIRKAVFTEVARREHRLSRHAFAVRQQVHASSVALRDQLGRWPTNAEVAEDSGLPLGVVSRIREADTRGADPSLDAPIGDDGLTLADVLHDDDDAPGAPLEFDLDRLSELTAHVPLAAVWCGLRYHGLNGTWCENYAAIGAGLGVSREPPRKLVAKFDEGMRAAIMGEVPAADAAHDGPVEGQQHLDIHA